MDPPEAKGKEKKQEAEREEEEAEGEEGGEEEEEEEEGEEEEEEDQEDQVQKGEKEAPKGAHYCGKCGSFFSKSSNLTRHVRQVHGDGTEGPWCGACAAIFTSNHGLKRHYTRFPKCGIFVQGAQAKERDDGGPSSKRRKTDTPISVSQASIAAPKGKISAKALKGAIATATPREKISANALKGAIAVAITGAEKSGKKTTSGLNRKIPKGATATARDLKDAMKITKSIGGKSSPTKKVTPPF